MVGFAIREEHGVMGKSGAAVMGKRSPGAADECIAKALRQLTAEMRRQGIPGASMRREVHALEARVRGAVWRLTFPWVDETRQSPHTKVQGRRRHRRSTLPARQLTFPRNRDDQ